MKEVVRVRWKGESMKRNKKHRKPCEVCVCEQHYVFVELYNSAVNFLAKRPIPRLDKVQCVVMLNVHCRLVSVPVETLFHSMCSVPEG